MAYFFTTFVCGGGVVVVVIKHKTFVGFGLSGTRGNMLKVARFGRKHVP